MGTTNVSGPGGQKKAAAAAARSSLFFDVSDKELFNHPAAARLCQKQRPIQ
jgi:hypothetical protein